VRPHDGDYEETGWVEQTNIYGRREHRDWIAVVHHEGGENWRLVYLHLDRVIVGKYVPDSP
jgi:hypothetical protein